MSILTHHGSAGCGPYHRVRLIVLAVIAFVLAVLWAKPIG
jgi:hypothetical protein